MSVCSTCPAPSTCRCSCQPPLLCDVCFQSHVSRDPEGSHYRLALSTTPDQSPDSDFLLREISRLESQFAAEAARVQAKLDRLERDMTALVHMHVENRKSEFRTEVSTLHREMALLKASIDKGKSNNAVFSAFLSNPAKGLEALNSALDSLNFSLDEAFSAFKAIKLVDLKPVSDLFFDAYFVKVRVEMEGKVVAALPLSRETSVYQVKEACEKEIGVSPMRMQLMHNDIPLEGCRRLEEFDFAEPPTFRLCLVDEPKCVLYIQPNQLPRFALDFDLSDSVGALKSRLSVAMDLPVSNFRLVYMGHHLRDAETVSSYGIKPNSTLFLAFASRQLLRLVVKVSSGKLLPVDIYSDETISKLKEVVAGLTEIPVANQHILSNGKELPNSRTLEACSIKSESVLELTTADTLFDSLSALQLFVQRKLHSLLKT